MKGRNALAVLAEKLEADKKVVSSFRDEFGDKPLGEGQGSVGELMVADIDKAQRIIAKLATEWEPIDRSKVEKGADGRVHLVDIVKAGDKRRCEILIACLEIAEEGQA